MLLRPANYSAEWKLLLQQMLDFIAFKELMAPKHYQLIENLAKSDQDNTETKTRLESER